MSDSDRCVIWFDHGLGDCSQFARVLCCYQQLGFQFSVHYEENKKAIFDIIEVPYASLPSRERHHDWIYPSGFNKPLPQDGPDNKVWANFISPLPSVSLSREELFERVCNIHIDAACFVSEEIKKNWQKRLDGFPRPIILIHGIGSNWQNQKSLPKDQYVHLVSRLLDETSAGIVLLDWDNRDPYWPNARVRHVKRHFGHIDLYDFLGLLHEAYLLIGIDSGPYHFASTFCPHLGVIGWFKDLYVSSVSLPNPNSANLVGKRWEHVNKYKRQRWNVIECDSHNPDVEDLLKIIKRGLCGPRYLPNGPFGREMQLQHWILDWQNTSKSPSWRGRSETWDWTFMRLSAILNPRIVETGCIRGEEKWVLDGYSTYLFAAYLDGRREGTLESIDIKPEHCNFAYSQVSTWNANVRIICSDSVEYLRNIDHPIDLLYIDSLDAEHPNSADHALKEVQAAEKWLTENALILIDDTAWDREWIGKGAKAVPYLLDRGWKIVKEGWQVLLARKS